MLVGKRSKHTQSGRFIMAGTRTAGTVDGTPLFTDVSLHWIDIAGDLRSDSYQCLAAAADADVEVFAAAMQAASTASLWKVSVSAAYTSTPQASNAQNAAHQSADDVINMLQKTASNQAQDVVIHAPLQALFVGETEVIDTTDALLTAISGAFQDIADGTYGLVSYRYTEHREINKRQRV